MKRLFFTIAFLCALSTVGLGQGSTVRVREEDGSHRVPAVGELVFPTGSLTVSGNVVHVAGGGGGGSGTVTSISVVTANGVSASCATCTTTPALTFVLGAITPTTVNGLTVTPTTSGALTIANSKTLTASNTLALNGTDGSSVAFGAGGTVAYTANNLSAFASTTSAQLAGVLSNETGTGVAVFNDTPTLIAPILGTPTSGVATNITGLPISTGLTGAGTGVLTALGVNVGSAGAFVTFSGALGTPSSGTVTNLTGTASININGTVGATTPAAGAFTTVAASDTITQTSNSATAFESGANGGTNPTFRIVNSTASQASGVSLTGKADGTAPEFLSLSRTQITTALAGNGLAITADPAIAGSSVAGAAAGGSVTITGGNAARLTSGDGNGGNINLVFGAAIGSGRAGILTLGGTTTSFVGLKTGDVFGQKHVMAKLGDNTTTNTGFAGNRFISESTEGNLSTVVSIYEGNAQLSSGGLITFNSAANLNSGSADLTIRRSAAAHLALGAADASSPVAQTLSVQNVVAGTTNTAGATWTHRGSLGTSQGAPGRHSFTAGGLISASGTTQQTAVSRLELGATKVLTDNTLTTLVNVTDASNTVASGIVDYTIEVFDGTDLQMETGSFLYQVANKGGAFSLNTITPPTGFPKNAATSGSLTVTWGITGANPALLQVTADSSLTPSTGYPRITYSIRNLTQQAIAVQ